MSTRQIDLTFEMTKFPGPNTTDGFRLTCLAENGVDFTDNKIFRYERIPGFTVTDEDNDVFNGVCSPADLEELPVDSPNLSQQPAFFRLDTIDLVFRSAAAGEQAFQDIQDDVTRLVKSLDALDVLEPPVTVTIGPF